MEMWCTSLILVVLVRLFHLLLQWIACHFLAHMKMNSISLIELHIVEEMYNKCKQLMGKVYIDIAHMGEL